MFVLIYFLLDLTISIEGRHLMKSNVALKVHKIEIFLVPILNVVLFHC
jgi:hypothetical protein